jgi:hypothetical protein
VLVRMGRLPPLIIVSAGRPTGSFVVVTDWLSITLVVDLPRDPPVRARPSAAHG